MSKRLPLILDDDQFEAAVLAVGGLVLVGFWADWNGACHIMTPVVEAIAHEFDGRMTVVLVDTDRTPQVGARYGVESVPALLFFERGRLVDQVIGTQPKKRLAERAEALLVNTPSTGD